MRYSPIRSVFFGCLTTLGLLILLEITARVFISVSLPDPNDRTDITHEYKLWQLHLFDSFMGMHQPDGELLWRMRSDFDSPLLKTNSDGFVGAEIKTKESNEFRILFLGDSTPLGIGLDDFRESFVFLLRKHLAEGLLDNLTKDQADRKITVINASTAGYSSWQCLKLLQLRGDELSPDVVVGYFGNNDPSINGYLSDADLGNLSASYSGVKRMLAKSYLYQLLKGALLKAKGSEKSGELKPRVSVTEFEANLEAMRQWCQAHNCGLLLCTVPTPLLWPPGIQFKVFTTGRDRSGRLVMAEEMIADVSSQWALCLDTNLLPGTNDVWTTKVYQSGYQDHGDPLQAERFYREQLQSDPTNAQYLNNLAVILWREGKDPIPTLNEALSLDSLNPTILYNCGVAYLPSYSVKALRFLNRARELDNYSLRIKSTYNNTLRRFTLANHLPLADLEKLFTGLPDKVFFVDHCHPTLIGHRMIAKTLSRRVRQSQF